MSETEIIMRAEAGTPAGPLPDRVLGASTRFWLALLISETVCLMSVFGMKVEEPLYSAFLLSLGFYFGQKTK
jgi:hypothetical protein